MPAEVATAVAQWEAAAPRWVTVVLAAPRWVLVVALRWVPVAALRWVLAAVLVALRWVAVVAPRWVLVVVVVVPVRPMSDFRLPVVTVVALPWVVALVARAEQVFSLRHKQCHPPVVCSLMSTWFQQRIRTWPLSSLLA